jgi:hypothetical protein
MLLNFGFLFFYQASLKAIQFSQVLQKCHVPNISQIFYIHLLFCAISPTSSDAVLQNWNVSVDCVLKYILFYFKILDIYVSENFNMWATYTQCKCLREYIET